MDVLTIIQKHSLTVRCLPHIVISHWGFYEKLRPYIKPNQTIVVKDGREYIREEKVVENGGWWIVQRSAHTGSTIHFSTKNDFYAPTIEEAIQKFLDSLID